MNLYNLNHLDGNCNRFCRVFAEAQGSEAKATPNVRINLDLIERIDLEGDIYIVYLGRMTYRVHDTKAFDAALDAVEAKLTAQHDEVMAALQALVPTTQA